MAFFLSEIDDINFFNLLETGVVYIVLLETLNLQVTLLCMYCTTETCLQRIDSLVLVSLETGVTTMTHLLL